MVKSESKFFIAINISPMKNKARMDINMAPKDDSTWIVKMFLIYLTLPYNYGCRFVRIFIVVIAKYAPGSKCKGKKAPLRNVANTVKTY